MDEATERSPSHGPCPIRSFAIDWSGDHRNGRRKIWLAEVRLGKLIRLENGRNREQLTDHLIEEALKDPRCLVGLDFAFSFPQWYCKQIGARTVLDVWDYVTRHGEAMLASCCEPFYGKPGVKRLTKEALYRHTERNGADALPGIRPKSVFQIGGAGAVGTGSIRGMPTLLKLQAAGFSIWPFDPPRWPTVVEIYPRALTGPVNKSSREQRERYLVRYYPRLPVDLASVAASCEDAFDAAVSALVMHGRLGEFSDLQQTTDLTESLEGRISY